MTACDARCSRYGTRICKEDHAYYTLLVNDYHHTFFYLSCSEKKDLERGKKKVIVHFNPMSWRGRYSRAISDDKKALVLLHIFVLWVPDIEEWHIHNLRNTGHWTWRKVTCIPLEAVNSVWSLVIIYVPCATQVVLNCRCGQRLFSKINMVYVTLMPLSRFQRRLQHMYHGQPYARVDLNPMHESTLSFIQGLRIWPLEVPASALLSCHPCPECIIAANRKENPENGALVECCYNVRQRIVMSCYCYCWPSTRTRDYVSWITLNRSVSQLEYSWVEYQIIGREDKSM